MKYAKDVPDPAKLKKLSEWDTWYPQFLSCLSQKLRGHTIPLS